MTYNDKYCHPFPSTVPNARIIVADTLNLSLTDELRAFVDANCGDGTLYATPSEFVRDLLREKKQRQQASEIRARIIDGYQDAINGRSVEFKGDLKSLLKKVKR